MLSELSIAISEIEQSPEYNIANYSILNDIATALEESTLASIAGRLNDILYARAQNLLNAISETVSSRTDSMNAHEVELIYTSINSVYQAIDYGETPLEKMISARCAQYENNRAMNNNNNNSSDDDSDDEDDDIIVILYTDKPFRGRRYKPEPVVQYAFAYDITHSADIHKDIFFHNMTMAMQRFCTNYGCIFDGYTIKCAYCNITFTQTLKEVASKKLRYGCQTGVVTLEYKYTSADLKNNTKEITDGVNSAIAELYNGLNMYAKCDYLCPY